MNLFSRNLNSLFSSNRTVYMKNVINELLKNKIRLYTAQAEVLSKKSIRSMRTVKKKKFNFDGVATALLVIPVSAFALGTWQIQRKMWKEKQVQFLAERVKEPPIELPHDLDQLKDLEYRPVKVKGRFDHSCEIYLGPRTVIKHNKYSEGANLISKTVAGYLVITPFKLSDRDITILVNRGWVPANQKSPKTRQAGQVTEEIELVGLVRATEHRKPLGMKNIPEKGVWLYRDLEKMSEYTGAAPIMIDAVESSSLPGGPIGGQTIIELRNEHLSYIVTWYTLSVATGIMWYNRYVRKVPV